MLSDQIKKRVDRLRVPTEVPACFAQYDFCSVERAVASGQDRDTPFMPLIRGIQPADQRASVNDGSYFHNPRGWKDRRNL